MSGRQLLFLICQSCICFIIFADNININKNIFLENTINFNYEIIEATKIIDITQEVTRSGKPIDTLFGEYNEKITICTSFA